MRRSRKASKLRVTGLCEGNSPGTGEFPAQRAIDAENVSIWWRHHVFGEINSARGLISKLVAVWIMACPPYFHVKPFYRRMAEFGFPICLGSAQCWELTYSTLQLKVTPAYIAVSLTCWIGWLITSDRRISFRKKNPGINKKCLYNKRHLNRI